MTAGEHAPQVLHVVPLGDHVDHAGEGDRGRQPMPEPIKAASRVAGRLVIHHSLDGRESITRP